MNSSTVNTSNLIPFPKINNLDAFNSLLKNSRKDSIPPKETGYVAPKKGDHWNTEKKGWDDKYGNVWREDKSGHGGRHWDVEYPNGGYDNVYPDGTVRAGSGGRGRFSPQNTSCDDIGWKIGAFIGGAALIGLTIFEDVATCGAGIADDPATIGVGLGMIGNAFGLY